MSSQAEHRRKVWVFNRGEWTEIPDPLPGEDGDYFEEVHAAGYSGQPTIRLGIEYCGFEVQVHDREHPLAPDTPVHPYFVSITAGPIEDVYVTDFPSLVMLLGK